MNECVIYDFETLSQDQRRGVVTSFAIISYSEKKFTEGEGYTYEQLLDMCHYIKFDVEDQVKNFSRKISKETVDWWNEQGDEAKKQIRPSALDVSISTLHQFLVDRIDCKNLRKAYTRGNTFDPMFLQYIFEDCGQVHPFHWRTTRDTRSMIEGMSFGMDIDNDFMPGDLKELFVKHDPRHDIAMDVMRMQMLAQAILIKE